MSGLIPDDAVIYVSQKVSSVRYKDKAPEFVTTVAETGFPGTFEQVALAHIYNTSNPHHDSTANIVLPTGKAAKWFIFGTTALEITDDVPIYPEDIHPVVSEDGLVRTDEDGPNRTLSEVMAWPFYGDDEVHLRGDWSKFRLLIDGNNAYDISDKVPARHFYGTDAAGTVGFNFLPGEQVVL